MVESSSPPVVRVENLTVDFWEQRWLNVVNQVSFSIYQGETLGLAGESGCGKSTTAFSLFGYRRPGSRVSAGAIYFQGQNLLALNEHALQTIRGAQICLVPQNPASALTPSMRVGGQIVESLEAHQLASASQANARTLDLLAQVGLPNPKQIASRYPFQLSGGQQQRVVIAMALAGDPKLLVLDEPTTALDVTTQARVLKLLARLQAERGMSTLYVTHNLGVLAQIADRVAVMYAGELVEIAPTTEFFQRPLHPYTRGLIAAVPRLRAPNTSQAKLRGLLRREELPPGCRFAPRCPFAQAECFTQPQALATAGAEHQVACWKWQRVAQEDASNGQR